MIEGKLRLALKHGLFEATPAGLPGELAILEAETYGDLDAQFELRINENLPYEDQSADAVLALGYEDRSNFLFVRFSADALQSGLYAVDDGVVSMLASASSYYTSFETFSAHLVREGEVW